MAAVKDEVWALYRRELAPQLAWIEAIRAALPEDGILVEDLTQIGYVSRIAFPVYGPRQYISSGYQGTLGMSLPVALGAKVACPGRPVVAIAGDGGFMYNVQELATAVQHGIAVVAVVFDDGAYGNVRRMQRQLYGNRIIASDLRNPDFVQLATASAWPRARSEAGRPRRCAGRRAGPRRAGPDHGQGRRDAGPLALHPPAARAGVT